MEIPRAPNGRVLAGSVLNPKGRPKRGAAIEEWSDAMADWTRGRLQAVIDDPEAKASKVTAARHTLGMMRTAYSKSGRPEAIEDLREALDRSLGKPAQAIDLRSVNVNIKRIELVDTRQNQPALVEEPADALEYEDGVQGAD